MAVRTRSFKVSTRGHCHVMDITSDVQARVRESELKEGTATIFVTGSTAGVTTVEYEPGLVKDLAELFERIAPAGASYHHEERWHDGNGHSHVCASLLGPSLTVPFSDGKLLLGTWQQIVLIDFDNRPRNRDIVITLMGE